MKKVAFIYTSYEITDEIAEVLYKNFNINKIKLPLKFNIVKRIIRKLVYRYENMYILIPMIYPELKNIEKDEIIFNFSEGGKTLGKYLNYKYPNNRKIYWAWDLACFKEINILKKYYEEIYTFDEIKARQYDLNFLPQFYWKNNLSKKSEENDLYFIGYDKGRLKIIKKLIKELDGNIRYKFYILGDKYKKYSGEDKKILEKGQLNYKEVVENIKKSRCILDLNQEEQSGLTLRIMEGIFYGKKIITNNSFVKNYDFYNHNNILILNFEKDRNIKNKIKEFLMKEYIPIFKEIIKKYSVEYWFESIIRR